MLESSWPSSATQWAAKVVKSWSWGSRPDRTVTGAGSASQRQWQRPKSLNDVWRTLTRETGLSADADGRSQEEPTPTIMEDTMAASRLRRRRTPRPPRTLRWARNCPARFGWNQIMCAKPIEEERLGKKSRMDTEGSTSLGGLNMPDKQLGVMYMLRLQDCNDSSLMRAEEDIKAKKPYMFILAANLEGVKSRGQERKVYGFFRKARRWQADSGRLYVQERPRISREELEKVPSC